MQLVSRGTSAALWDLHWKVPRGTFARQFDADICVPRGTSRASLGIGRSGAVFHMELSSVFISTFRREFANLTR